MALTAISPFPADTAPTQLRAAINILRGVLKMKATTADTGEYDAVDRLIQRIATAVSAHVEAYAPDAPAACRSEAVIRATCYLWDTCGASREFQPDRTAAQRILNPTDATGFAFDRLGAGGSVQRGLVSTFGRDEHGCSMEGLRCWAGFAVD